MHNYCKLIYWRELITICSFNDLLVAAKHLKSSLIIPYQRSLTPLIENKPKHNERPRDIFTKCNITSAADGFSSTSTDKKGLIKISAAHMTYRAGFLHGRLTNTRGPQCHVGRQGAIGDCNASVSSSRRFFLSGYRRGCYRSEMAMGRVRF